MTNTIQHKRGINTPAGGIARGELAIQEVAANYTTSSSSKLWLGEGDTPNLRQIGFGIYDGTNQSGIPIGGNLTFTGGTGINTSVSSGTLTITAVPTGDYYSNWTLAADSGSSQTISSGNTASILGAAPISTAASATDTVTISLDNDGITDTHLAYNTGQHLTTTSAPTFATVNTGQGANELYGMDQNVLTTSTPSFEQLTITDSILTVKGEEAGNSLIRMY
ncbi:MAG: hypothetical protein QF535_04940, partial [Anaerolineales bacterium]|nr:hypothetical protein [Anaerolineales bacterium]